MCPIGHWKEENTMSKQKLYIEIIAFQNFLLQPYHMKKTLPVNM